MNRHHPKRGRRYSVTTGPHAILIGPFVYSNGFVARFQTNAWVTVQIFAKKQKKENVTVDISEGELSVTIKLEEPGKEFLYNIDLCDKVIPAESSVSDAPCLSAGLALV